MPGGRISQLITDPMGGFALVRRALIPREWRQGQEDRAFPIIQTILDRGDAASWAQHILARRVNDTEAPHVLIHVAKDDGIVTNGANYAFARSIGVGLLPPQVDDAPGLTLLDAAPLAMNAAGGTRSAALQQFDTVEDPEGGDEPVQANHINLTLSEVAQHAWFHFLETYWETGTPEIVDPYEELGLPHADADDD